MSLGLYIAAIIAKDAQTLREVLADPAMVEKSARKYGIKLEHAAYYLKQEIIAKEAGL